MLGCVVKPLRVLELNLNNITPALLDKIHDKAQVMQSHSQSLQEESKSEATINQITCDSLIFPLCFSLFFLWKGSVRVQNSKISEEFMAKRLPLLLVDDLFSFFSGTCCSMNC
jgi:hypothetical protein